MKENNKPIIKAKGNVFIDNNIAFGKNVIVYPNNYIEGNCTIGDNVVLLPNNFISNSQIGEGCKIFSSVIENSEVGDKATIGPFAHLRPNSKIKSGAKIGNFVEVKNSEVGEKTKISHLTYVGDAKIGKNVNIGCGVVFVNYNGRIKQKTQIGDNSFIGSSVNLIAPLNIGSDVFVCAGTTVDKDLQNEAFVIGRSKMNIKPFRAKKYLKGDS